jgi:pilus assembly protein FimV
MRFGLSAVTKFVTRFRPRYLSLTLMLLLIVASRGSFALGLGEMQVTSVINEPLAATIPVLNADGVQQSELIVALGSASDYEATGVTWDFSHSELQFDVTNAANGALVVNVTSSRPIREPYLNVLVQARWPAGRLLMEYTVLLDFPVFSGSTDSASASSSSSASSTISTATTPAPQPAAAPTPAPTPQPVQVAPAPRATTAAPSQNAAPTRRVDALAADEFRIQNGDTLWSIGGRIAQDLGVSRHQAMMAIREANPEAFIQGDINLLRSGSVVRVPPRSAALARSEAQAAADFAQSMSGSGRLADGTPLQSRVTDFRDEGGTAQEGTAQFRLTAGTQTDAGAAGSGVEELVAENQTLSDINAALEEELAAAEIANRDLNQRLQNLEEQISVMEALIEVENNEIRAVQDAVTAVQPVVQPVTTAAVVEEPGIVSRILSWLPLVGLVLIGLLAGAYLLIRRKKANSGFEDTEYVEDAPLYEEDQEPSAQSEDEHSSDEEPSAEIEPQGMPDLEDEGDLDDFMGLSDAAIDETDASDEPNIENQEESLEDNLSDFGSEEVAVDPEQEDEEEDWGSDFDDLDSFFSDAEGDESGSSEDTPEVAAEDEEDESDKTQILDAATIAAMTAGESSPDEAEQDESESELDFSAEIDSEEDSSDESPEQELDRGSEEENSLDFALDEEELADSEPEPEAVNTSAAEDDEFSMDFDLDEEDLAPVQEESVEESEDDAADDENTLSFDVSDADLPEQSEAEVESEAELDSESEDEDDSDLDALLVDSDDSDADDVSDFSFDDLSDDSSEDDAEIEIEAEAETLAETEGDDADLDSLLDDLDEVIEEETGDSEDDSEEGELELPDLDEAGDDLLSDFGEADLDDVETEAMSDADEAETKLELASAYIEMGDSTGAKELLEEVVRDGDEDSKAKATAMLESLS